MELLIRVTCSMCRGSTQQYDKRVCPYCLAGKQLIEPTAEYLDETIRMNYDDVFVAKLITLLGKDRK